MAISLRGFLLQVYVYDISNLPLNSFLSMYADDTVLCCSGNDLSQIRQSMNDDLLLVHDWMIANKLTINPSKTKCTLFSINRKHLNYPDIYLGRAKIEFVDTYEYLGFVLDSCLSFQAHLSRTLQKINSKAVILYKVRNLMNPRIALQMYKTFLLPILDYVTYLCVPVQLKLSRCYKNSKIECSG